MIRQGDAAPRDFRKLGDSALTAPTTPSKQQPVLDRSKIDPETLQAAEEYEGMFLDYMMKVMRETVPKSEMDLENTGTEVYRSMMDSEVAKKAAHAGGVGLADQIVAYLDPNRYNYNVGQGLQQPGAHGQKASPQTQNGNAGNPSENDFQKSDKKSVTPASTRRYP